MKQLFVLLGMFFFGTGLTAQTTFIHSQNWDSIVAAAQTNQKLIFVDAYTDWCGWCKVMDQKTFSNAAIGNMMDQNFINVKLEMEKEELGIKLATKYAVSSFPTYLIFNPKGEMIYQTFGYQEAAAFMTTLSQIIMPENHVQRPGYSADFEVDYPEFYRKFMGNSKKKKFPSTEEINKWISGNHDLSKEAHWTVYKRFYYDLNAKNRAYFWNQKAMVDSLYGPDMTVELAGSLLYMDVKELVPLNDPAKVELLLKEKLPYVDQPEESGRGLRLYYAKETKNWNEVNRQLNKLYKEKGIEDPEAWNQECWDIYEKSDDTVLVQSALVWIDAVVKLDPQYNHLDTYAALLFKAGKLDEAESKAKEAIAVGIAENRNVKETEALLKKIQEARSPKEK